MSNSRRSRAFVLVASLVACSDGDDQAIRIPATTVVLDAETRAALEQVSDDLAALAFDVRLICATNMPIYEMVKEHRFRQDLLFRLNTVEITVPPLRQRRDDILPIADHFAQLYARKYGRKAHSGRAMMVWPSSSAKVVMGLPACSMSTLGFC